MIELYSVSVEHGRWPANPKRKTESEKASKISANEYKISNEWRVMK